MRLRLTDFEKEVGQRGGEDPGAQEGQHGADGAIGGSLPEDDQADARNGQGREDDEGLGFLYWSPFSIMFYAAMVTIPIPAVIRPK
jgi:hypothetical protein